MKFTNQEIAVHCEISGLYILQVLQSNHRTTVTTGQHRGVRVPKLNIQFDIQLLKPTLII